ncbi:hypothetical protein A4H97_29555 [Niastella yeongjuensis]|uniref:Outer membrane protein beta-barrel domain-containing protein n=1 Tax=Niastella yeongjuensis TaxID=354355 RepID=A0A1V9ES99_9BACT|nr:hypothetical protein [Niastella yeongjuensis]OQP49028.1 hypothetical protein A4H97_29555 [Niastella yeongjuensis]SEP10831.1 hypothetical protein SAMN05660816_04408 [Niastella yeongjuensis]
MKKINLTLLILIIGINSFAQYKKANYFGKEGRTYGVGTRFYAMGEGIGTKMGYSLSVGSETEGKRFIGGYELQYIPKHEFQFWTLDHNNLDALVDGTTKPTFIFQINLGSYLLSNDADRKIKPYVIANIIFQFAGGVKESTSEDTDAKYAAPTQFGVGVGAGAGSLFYLNSWLALKGEVGYAYTVGTGNNTSNGLYYIFPKHANASAGFVFRVGGKK